MIQAYEYREVFLPDDPTGDLTYLLGRKQPMEWLNEMGGDGWLLVSIGPSWTISTPARQAAIFVRLIPAEQ